MKIKKIVVGLLHTNCYLLIDEKTKEAIIVDPGFNSEKIIEEVEKEDCNLKYLMLTHAHFDHCFEAHFLKEKYNLKLIAHKNSKEVINNLDYNQSINFVKKELYLPLNDEEIYLDDGDEFNVGDIKIKLIYIGGHTIDSSAFYFEKDKILICGDTLFFTSIGRSDLPGGNEEQLIENIENKILTLPSDTKVLPGHGDETTIGYESVYNEYI